MNSNSHLPPQLRSVATSETPREDFGPKPIESPISPMFAGGAGSSNFGGGISNGRSRPPTAAERPPPIIQAAAQIQPPERITLLTKFTNDAVFFAGEKLSCTFTFVPPGYNPYHLTPVFASPALPKSQASSAPVVPEIPSYDDLKNRRQLQETKQQQQDRKPKVETEPVGDQEDEGEQLAKASDIQRRITEHEIEPAKSQSTGGGGILSWFWPFGSSGGSSPVENAASSPSKSLPSPREQDELEMVHQVIDVVPSPVDKIVESEASAHYQSPLLSNITPLPESVGTPPSQHIFSDTISRERVNRSDSAAFPPMTGTASSVFEVSGGSKDSNEFNIALAFVQIVGYLAYDPALVRLPAESESTRELLKPAGGGGMQLADMHQFILDTKAIPVLVSSPTILFANMNLRSRNGDFVKRTFNFEAILPPILPPTHRGRACRIQYRMIIGLQKNIYDSPHFIHLPFRVFSLVQNNGAQTDHLSSEPATMGRQDIAAYSVEDERELLRQRKQEKQATFDLLTAIRHGDDESAYANKSKLVVSKMPDTHRGRTLAHVTQLSEQSRPSSFDICKNNQHIARLKLSKTIFRLGEIISASLDFSESVLRCFQVSVYLEYHETVNRDVTVRSPQDTKRLTTRIISEQHELCLQISKMPVILCIPTSSSPNFASDLVTVSWQIRIEFTTQRGLNPIMEHQLNSSAPKYVTMSVADQLTEIKSESAAGAPEDIYSQEFKTYRARTRVAVESFDCEIPIHVFPCDWENARLYPHRQKFVMMETPKE
eukprot:Partr_v1_DN26840_c2_g1_i1_m40521 putative RGP1 retrograde golgi transport homolog (S. cerevisiae)